MEFSVPDEKSGRSAPTFGFGNCAVDRLEYPVQILKVSRTFRLVPQRCFHAIGGDLECVEHSRSGLQQVPQAVVIVDRLSAVIELRRTQVVVLVVLGGEMDLSVRADVLEEIAKDGDQ